MDLTRGGPQSKDVNTILFDGSGQPLQQVRQDTRPQGYETFFMLKSNEHEIYPTYKY